MTKGLLKRAKVLSGFDLNTCSQKLEQQALDLHKFRVWNISLFLVKKYVVNSF